MAKTISERQRLEAFALYTMASNHYKQARDYERGASAILGPTDGMGEFNDAVSDGIYGEDAGRSRPFDAVLKMAGVKVRPAKKRAAR